MPTLYYTNASEDQNWETLSNWNTAADGSGDNPTNIPWTDDGNGGSWYSDADLIDASGGVQIFLYSHIDENEVVTGSCDITGVSLVVGSENGAIYGGTFTGSDMQNFGDGIYGGTFTGNDFYNYSTINGGVFSGNYFHNYSLINGGTFSGMTFDNASGGSIFDGAFTGVNFNNSGGTINGGEFSGYNFYNNSTIYGGAFSGDGFRNAGNITGITFSGNGFTNEYGAQILNSHFRANSGFSDWSVSGCYFESDGIFSQDGKNYTYASEFVAVTYPQSGGGGGIDIARLLGLPFFVKI